MTPASVVNLALMDDSIAEASDAPDDTVGKTSLRILMVLMPSAAVSSIESVLDNDAVPSVRARFSGRKFKSSCLKF